MEKRRGKGGEKVLENKNLNPRERELFKNMEMRRRISGREKVFGDERVLGGDIGKGPMQWCALHVTTITTSDTLT